MHRGAQERHGELAIGKAAAKGNSVPLRLGCGSGAAAPQLVTHQRKSRAAAPQLVTHQRRSGIAAPQLANPPAPPHLYRRLPVASMPSSGSGTVSVVPLGASTATTWAGWRAGKGTGCCCDAACHFPCDGGSSNRYKLEGTSLQGFWVARLSKPCRSAGPCKQPAPGLWGGWSASPSHRGRSRTAAPCSARGPSAPTNRARGAAGLGCHCRARAAAAARLKLVL